MKITVLDRCTIEKDCDIDWSPITLLGETMFYDLLTDEETVEAAKDSEILLVNKKVITKEIIEKLPSLRYIGLFATGCNNIDLEAASERGILVANAPNYSTDFVAQTVFAFILNFANSVPLYNEAVKSGEWIRSKTFSFFTFPLTELRGKTLGIFGLGSIGKRVAEIATAFGMRVIVTTRTQRTDNIYESVDKETLFCESDFLSVHCPLTNDTRELVNENTLSLMKPTAYLINTSRGGTVNEKALADALNSGKIAGAAVDVLSKEPMQADNPLLTARNCVITPHIAWAARETRERLVSLVADNIKHFIGGEPINIVNRG